MHQLVVIAKERCYLNSHQYVKMIIPDNKETEEFYYWAERLIRNIIDYPHALLLASLMDTNVDANVAWTIPYRVFKACGKFDIQSLYNIPLERYELWFSGNPSWHRHPIKKAKVFFDAVHKIVEDSELQGDASRLWKNKPCSQNLITRLLRFNGCGLKIANMIPNLLLRYYGVELLDYENIDIAPDVHTVRVFGRLGLVPIVDNGEAAKIYTIVKARELNKKFPGVVDGLCWEVGKYYCRPNNPRCMECPLNLFCEFRLKSVPNQMLYNKNEIHRNKKDRVTEGFSLDELKDEFTSFQHLKSRNPDRIKEDRSWSFTHYHHNIGIGFWDSFRDEEGLKKCRECIENVAKNGGFSGKGVKDPKGYAATYLASVARLKEFFDEKYGGVDNYLSLHGE